MTRPLHMSVAGVARATPATDTLPTLRDEPRTVRWLPIPTGWPLIVTVAGYPVSWALGLGSFALPLLAVPMVVQLWRRRPIRVPPGFGLWLLFLLWVVASGLALGVHAPGTLAGDVPTRVLSASTRLASYLAATITLLYVGNLVRELPRKRVVVLLGVFFCEVAGFGCLALFWPHAQFTSPFELLLPGSLRSNGYVHQLVHPQLAQNMTVLGYALGRPTAPFPYTNVWGDALSVLLPWFMVWCWAWGTARRKLLTIILLGITAVPLVYSLNRGVWIGLGVAVTYVAVRMAAHGRVRVLGGLLLAAVATSTVITVTPLQTIIVERLNHPHSNSARFAQDMLAVEGALHSPVIGYGSTRNMAGSRQSITIGKSASCPTCGNPSTGGAGQLWLLIFAQGFAGVGLYLAFLIRTLWRCRRDHTPIGIAASTVLVLSLVYLPFYGQTGVPLLLTMIAVALLWRNANDSGAELPA